MLFLIFAVALQAHATNNSSVPRFEQYKVTSIFRRRPVVPVLRTPEDREYRTRIREGAKKGPNFAGHYTVILLGCGYPVRVISYCGYSNGVRIFSCSEGVHLLAHLQARQ